MGLSSKVVRHVATCDVCGFEVEGAFATVPDGWCFWNIVGGRILLCPEHVRAAEEHQRALADWSKRDSAEYNRLRALLDHEQRQWRRINPPPAAPWDKLLIDAEVTDE